MYVYENDTLYQLLVTCIKCELLSSWCCIGRPSVFHENKMLVALVKV